MNPAAVHYLNTFLALGAMILLAVSFATLIFFGFWPKGRRNSYFDLIHRHFLLLGFLLALASSVTPIIYSEYVGFAACALCWWQRVFMFPNMFLFAVALWQKDRGVARYALPLLSVGILISLYHNYGQYFRDGSSLPCDASGVSCYQFLIPEFGGLIQIPLMSFAAYFALITLIFVAHFYGKGNMLQSDSGR